MWHPEAKPARRAAAGNFGLRQRRRFYRAQAYNHQAAPSNLQRHPDPSRTQILFTLPILPLTAQSSSCPSTQRLNHPFLGDHLIPNTSQHGEPASSVLSCPSQLAVLTRQQPSATGSSWEKYQKNYADDEVEEKKITPLSDESVLDPTDVETQLC